MTIVLEGPPAAGKSTISRSLQLAGGYYVVPEVNMLFRRPQPEPGNWYLDRQVCRWEIGMRQEESYSGVIFDGDIFQPFWFNWIFSDENWNSLEHNEAYYRKAIMMGRIRFPDSYMVLTLPEEERWTREYNRSTEMGRDSDRARGKFERYKRVVRPQQRYFDAFSNRFPGRVQFLRSTTPEATITAITEAQIAPKSPSDIIIFDFLIDWLRNNEAEPTSVVNDEQALRR